jgi:chromosome segregation ATPase
MLVVLGFSIAGLIACALAPAYRRRAARLATLELKRTMPLTEAEIAADKDRIRADYAIRVHRLETDLEHLTVENARQLVEINRRDARISALEGDVASLSAVNEEHDNARRVLELTITERLPKVEQRLADAKKLLFERDREILSLTQTAQRQAVALEEATQINAQQRNDIHRLNATLTTRAARHRDKAQDQKHEVEVALRTEIEALRARVRDQADMIARLQQGTAADEPGAGSELARLRASLSDAERALQEAQRTDTPTFAHGEAELRALRSTVEDQTTELTRLRSELAALNAQRAAAGPGATENNGALASKISILEAETAQQAALILSLRAEIAAGNEKLARQAEFYMDEMKNLAAGTRPVAPPAETASTPLAAQRLSLAERMNAPRVAPVQLPNAAASIASNENEAEQSSRDEENADVNAAAPRRQSLLQRITGLEKPVA